MGLLQEDASDYLDETAWWWVLPLTWPAGEIVSSLAMIIWIATVAGEIQRICCLQATLVELLTYSPRSSATPAEEDLVINETEDGYDIVRMTNLRKVCATFFVQLPRAAMAIGLLYWGLIWLADTETITDLILNACALAIVSGIDEALFAAVLTNIVPVNRFQFEPRVSKVSRSKRRKWALEMAHFLAPCAFISLFFWVGHYAKLDAFVSYVQIAEDHMCGGDLQFVYASHPVSGMPYFASTATQPSNTSEQSTIEQLRCVYAAGTDMIALRAGLLPTWAKVPDDVGAQLLGASSDCTTNGGGVLCPTGTLQFLSLIESLSTETYYDGSNCVDQAVHMTVLRSVCLHDIFLDGSEFFLDRRSCGDFVDICSCTYHNTEGHCADDETSYAEVIEAHNVTYSWIGVIQALCPKSCNMCKLF
jgi:hypothetical protein